MQKIIKDRKGAEARRLKAIPLFQEKMTQAEVARKLGVSREAVRHWYDAWKNGSDLKARKTPGRPLLMEDDAVEAAMRLIERRPHITARQLREWIWDAFQIDYHHEHIYRVMQSLKRRMKKETYEPVVGD